MDVFSEKFMKDAFSQSTYYILLLLFLAWFLSLIGFIRYKRFEPKNFTRKHWPGLLAALALSSVVFVSVPMYPRVLSDETNLLSVSRSMTFDRRVSNVVEGRMSNVSYQALNKVEEKRPYLTPFIYHLVNVFLGYDARHAFVANFIGLFILYFLVYALVASGFGAAWGIAAMLLAAAQPILSICAASCGMDFFNAVLILAAFMSLREYLKEPSAPSFLFLWMNLCLLTHARYESILYFACVMAGLALLKKIRLEYFRSSLSYWFTPVFFLPAVYQRISKWTDKELPGGSVSTAFSFHDFLSHNWHFVRLLVNADFFVPIAVAVNFAGVVATAYFAARFFTKKDVLKEPSNRTAVLLFLVPIAALWILTTAYYFGRVDHPVSVRLFLPYLLFLSIAAAFFIAHAFSRLKHDARAGIALSLAAFLVYHPVAVKDRFATAISTGREYRYVLKFLESQPDKRCLLISPYPNLFTPYLYSSIGITRAVKRPNRVLRLHKERLFREIFVMQMVEAASGKVKEGMELPKKIQLETVSELQLRPGEYVRISRVVNPR